MNTSRRISRSRLARSLVILGAFLGVFALHSLSVDHDPLAAAPNWVAQSVVLQSDPLATSEGLERVAMLAPSVLAPDLTDHHHLLMPCLASLAGSLLLLLSAWLVLRRQRFGDEPRCAAVDLTAAPHRPALPTPQLAKLCILRT
jgi:hypothetical protein